MAKNSNLFVSAVLITDEHSKSVVAKVKRTTEVLKKSYANYEVVVIDNGVSTEELEKLKNILPNISCIRIISLARKYDIDTAIFAGVEASIGDYICTLYNLDPADSIPDMIYANQESDIVFGVAKNLVRGSTFEEVGAKLFYWYNRKFLDIDIPAGATYFMSINRTVANALTRGTRHDKHIRHLAKQIGFQATILSYELTQKAPYTKTTRKKSIGKAASLLTDYSNHPLRLVSYLGIFAGVLNVIYAAYVVLVNFSSNDVERGWTTLSLQASLMFFLIFMILAMISEYIGKILQESRKEAPYNIKNELSSTISLADETRRNIVT